MLDVLFSGQEGGCISRYVLRPRLKLRISHFALATDYGLELEAS
jgi:hypothetical protein